MKIKKGDLVEVITGASQANGGDRGKQGKVIAVYPERSRVLVEGVNRVKRHTKLGTSGRGTKTGGIVTQEAAIHVSNVMLVDPDTKKRTRVGLREDTVTRDGVERTTPGPRSPSARARTSEMTMTRPTDHRRRPGPKIAAAAEAALPRGDRAGAARGVRLRQRHADPDRHQGDRQHGRRRGRSRLQADRRRDQRPRRDHRPEAPGHQGPQVDRAVQAARGHADRRAHDAARRPDVGVPRPAAVGRAAPDPRLPRPVARASSTAAATTPSVSTSRRCSTRSTRTGPTASAAWTSPSSRPRTTDDEGRALLRRLGFPFKEN